MRITRPTLATAAFVAGAALTIRTATGDGGPCAADLDGCGSVGVSDVLILLGAWGNDPGHPADFDGDGNVGGADLGYLLGSWGACSEDLPMPQPAEIDVAVVEITDPDTLALGYREYDVFAGFGDPADELLNVYDADAGCAEPPCFLKPFPTGALPVVQELWDLLGMTYDSFVTIGLQFGDDNQTTLDPGFDAAAFEEGGVLGTDAGWFTIPPDGQAVAGDYADLEIRIATFTLAEGTLLEGGLSITWRNGAGELFTSTPALSVGAPPCPWDCADGGDGLVGTPDFLQLLAEWGLTGSPCDLGGDGVGTPDFLELLAHWGPCP